MFGNVKKPYRQGGHHPSDSQCSKRLCVFWAPWVSLKGNIEVYVHIYPHMNFRLISIPTRNGPASK